MGSNSGVMRGMGLPHLPQLLTQLVVFYSCEFDGWTSHDNSPIVGKGEIEALTPASQQTFASN